MDTSLLIVAGLVVVVVVVLFVVRPNILQLRVRPEGLELLAQRSLGEAPATGADTVPTEVPARNLGEACSVPPLRGCAGGAVPRTAPNTSPRRGSSRQSATVRGGKGRRS
jgi:hypothetical protein